MNIFPVAGIILLLAVFIALPGCSTQEHPDPDIVEMQGFAHELAGSVSAGLSGINKGLENNSRALSGTGLSGPGAEAVLANNLLSHPYAVSSLVISRDGVIMNAAPRHYSGTIGTNLSHQPEVQDANTKRIPMLSGVFPMVEGFSGVSQSYPVFSPSGEYLGYTDITYVPGVFLARYIEPATRGTPYDVWVAQAEGTEIYDTTKEEIGKNILTDPAYADPVLHEILVRIAREPQGNATYVFYDKDWKRTITKLAVWDTAGIDGTEWRVVVTKEIGPSTTTSPTARMTTTVSNGDRIANLTRFVESASAYAREQGREKALFEFNNPTGDFIEGDLYVFAYEMNGTVIALPYQPALLGTDRSLVSDPNGVEFITRMAELAKEGGGYVYYIYPNPADNYQDEFKISYVLPVDDQWFVGAGIYIPDLPAKFNTSERDTLVERVKQARRYAEVQGRAKAIADFNDLNGTFANGTRYIFA